MIYGAREGLCVVVSGVCDYAEGLPGYGQATMLTACCT